jgi:hypothetical protein
MLSSVSFRLFLFRMAMHCCGVLSLFTLLLSGSLLAASQVVSLSSGERLVGEVMPQSNDQVLVLKSNLLGEMSIQRTQIVAIEPQVIPAAKLANATNAARQPAEVKKQVGTQVAIAEKMTKVEQALEEEQPLVDKLFTFKAPEAWHGNLRMGMNISSGDKQWTETALRGKLEIKQQGDPNFYRFTGSYTYRETERSNGDTYKSTDRYDGAFIYRRSFAGDNWFIQNSMSTRVDQIKGIDRELQELVGVGYKVKPSNQFELLFGASGGLEEYQTDSENTRNGVNKVLNVFEEFTWKPFTRTSFVQKFNYYWEPDYTERYNYVLTAAVRIRLTDLLGFEFSYNQNYDNDIGNGNEKNDAVWRNALIVYF